MGGRRTELVTDPDRLLELIDRHAAIDLMEAARKLELGRYEADRLASTLEAADLIITLKTFRDTRLLSRKHYDHPGFFQRLLMGIKYSSLSAEPEDTAIEKHQEEIERLRRQLREKEHRLLELKSLRAPDDKYRLPELSNT